jgi:SAM-dependent methyltransferase
MQHETFKAETPSKIYSQLAPHYDALGWADFTDALWPHILRFFEMSGGQPSRFLDIACGTGLLAVRLAGLGIEVTGIDICQEMIDRALAKTYRPRVTFITGDMTHFRMDAVYPVTGCFYDSLNHLTNKRQFNAAIRCAHKHTCPGGYFLFDLLTERGISDWDPFSNMETGRFIVSQDGVYYPRRSLRLISVQAFVQASEDVQFIEQSFYERAYPLSYVEKLLAETGFDSIISTPFDPNEELDLASRVLFIARRRPTSS